MGWVNFTAHLVNSSIKLTQIRLRQIAHAMIASESVRSTTLMLSSRNRSLADPLYSHWLWKVTTWKETRRFISFFSPTSQRNLAAMKSTDNYSNDFAQEKNCVIYLFNSVSLRTLTFLLSRLCMSLMAISAFHMIVI